MRTPETEIAREPIMVKLFNLKRSRFDKNDFLKLNCDEQDTWVDLENQQGIIRKVHSPKNAKMGSTQNSGK
jgi:hypothetical protein